MKSGIIEHTFLADEGTDEAEVYERLTVERMPDGRIVLRIEDPLRGKSARFAMTVAEVQTLRECLEVVA